MATTVTTPRRKKPTEAQLLERHYERRIRNNNSLQAMLQLSAMLSRRASGIKRDPERAHQLLLRAATQHRSANTLSLLATASWPGHFHDSPDASRPTIPPAVSLELLEESLHLQETTDALCDMATLLGDRKVRRGVKKDRDRAVQLLERALARDDSIPQHSLLLLANLLALGKVSKPDPIRAVSLYKRYIKLSRNPAKAMFTLGCLYDDGRPPLKPCPVRARHWFERALRYERHPHTMFYLANLLYKSTQRDDILRAIELLEETISEIPHENATLLLAALYMYSDVVDDCARGAHLYRVAIREFHNTNAKHVLGLLYLSDKPGMRANPDEGFRLLREHYDSTASPATGFSLMKLYWSGTKSHAADRQRAFELCQKELGIRPSSYAIMACMHRYGHGNVVKQCWKQALRFLERIDGATHNDESFAWKELMLAIVLSEVDNDYKLLNHRVHDEFVNLAVVLQDKDVFLWVPCCLRRTRISLPVSGSENGITHAAMVEEQGEAVAILNLSSFLLEQREMYDKHEQRRMAVMLLERGVGRCDSQLAAINLGYVLWYGVAGVPKDRTRAMRVVEDVMKVSSHHLARTLLANMLAERDEGDDLQRAGELWGFVTRVVHDGEEVRRLSQLFSTRATRAIEEYCGQAMLRHHGG